MQTETREDSTEEQVQTSQEELDRRLKGFRAKMDREAARPSPPGGVKPKPERIVEGAAPPPSVLENQRLARQMKEKARRRAAAKKAAETRARNRRK